MDEMKMNPKTIQFLKKYIWWNLGFSIFYVIGILLNLFVFLQIEQWGIFLFVFFFLLLLWYYKRQYVKKMFSNLLYKACDPLTYKEASEHLMLHTKKKQAVPIYQMNIAYADLLLGEIEEMKLMLSGISPDDLSKLNRMVYYYRMLSLYEVQDDREAFYRMYNTFMEYPKENRLKLAEQKKYLELVQEAEFLKNAVDSRQAGKNISEEDDFVAACERVKKNHRSMAERVHAAYRLAEYYRSRGRAEDAVKFLYYVIEHGGSAVYVSRAATIIKES